MGLCYKTHPHFSYSPILKIHFVSQQIRLGFVDDDTNLPLKTE
jgi:hypothetical protein